MGGIKSLPFRLYFERIDPPRLNYAALYPIAERIWGVAELGYDKFIVLSQKNNTSKNAELMKCPECQSTHVNKNGQKKGKQNYICVSCGRQFIDCYQPHKGYSEEVKRECLKMYVNGMGFRAIERICMSTSHQHYKLGKACRRIAQRCLRTRDNSPGGRT
jgi:transposase-like protein